MSQRINDTKAEIFKYSTTIYIYIYIYIPGKIIFGEWKSTFKSVFNSNRVTTVDYQVATLFYDILKFKENL